MERIGVLEVATMGDCRMMTGKGPISTRWVDVAEGRDGAVDVRSRLVARDFNGRGDGREFDVCASMPPLEAKHLLFRMAVAKGAVGGDPRKGAVKLIFLDVKKAHSSGVLQDGEYACVQLPPETGGGVARLRWWLFGIRPVDQAWERAYSDKLVKEASFVRGTAASSVFADPHHGVRLVVSGNDFTLLDRESDLKEIAHLMAIWL